MSTVDNLSKASMAARLLGTWCLVAAFAQGDDEAWARAATLATAPHGDELVLERSCQGLGHGPVGLGNVVRRVPRYLRAAAARVPNACRVGAYTNARNAHRWIVFFF